MALTTPPTSCRNIYRASVWIASASLPLSGLIMWAWATKLYKHPAIGVRPQLVLMAYMAVLLVGMLAFCMAVLARLQGSVGDAFAQGYKIAHAELRLGFTPSDLTSDLSQQGQAPQLRAVE